ncbi:cytochrome P450 [Peniophora sp. CONT]|nr:cytochrome P450 [Peniophora sp. CONT]
MPILAALSLVLLLALREVIHWYFHESTLANLPGPGGYSWLTGHTKQLYHHRGWRFHLKDIVGYGSAVRLRGYLGEDILYITDPVALRTILVKEHGHIFDEPPMIIERNKLLWGPGLLSSTGSAHKHQRAIAYSVFSERRIKSMLPVMYDVVKKLEATLCCQLQFGSAEVDMMHWMSRCSLELIGQAGMGVSFDDLQKESESRPNKYMAAAKQLIPLSFPLQAFMRMIPYLVRLGSPELLGALSAYAPHANIRKLRKIAYFLYDTNAELYWRRRRAILAGDEMAMRRDDALSSLIRENECAPQDRRITNKEMISQIGTLIFAGQDTTSLSIARMLHVLALDQPRQDRLRTELRGTTELQSPLPYDELCRLPYLDAVCKETLRLHAPVTQLHRVPRQDVVIPLGRPVVGKNGENIEELQVEAGTFTVIGAAAVNRDKLIWGPTAEEWIPERWLESLPSSVAGAHLPSVYANLMTFMGGGRSCIGFKFAEAEIKVVLYVLISRFRFEPAPNADVHWNMYNFATPVVDDKPSLPLKMTILVP